MKLVKINALCMMEFLSRVSNITDKALHWHATCCTQQCHVCQTFEEMVLKIHYLVDNFCWWKMMEDPHRRLFILMMVLFPKSDLWSVCFYTLFDDLWSIFDLFPPFSADALIQCMSIVTQSFINQILIWRNAIFLTLNGLPAECLWCLNKISSTRLLF